MRERIPFEADDPLGVPCGIIMSQVEPSHEVARKWEGIWTKAGLDPLAAAWQETRSLANLVIVLREIVPEETARELVCRTLAHDSVVAALEHIGTLDVPSRKDALDAIRAAAPAPPPYGVLLHGLETIRAAVRADREARYRAEAEGEAREREARRSKLPRRTFAETFEHLVGLPIPFPIPEDAVSLGAREGYDMIYEPGLVTPIARTVRVVFDERSIVPISQPDAVRRILDLGGFPIGIFSTAFDGSQGGFRFHFHSMKEHARLVLEYDCPGMMWTRLGSERIAGDLRAVLSLERSATQVGASIEICLVGGYGYARVLRADGSEGEIAFSVPEPDFADVPAWMFDHTVMILEEPYRRSVSWDDVAALVSRQR